MISLAHIPPKASVMHKLNSNQSWQKRYLRFEDCTLQYAHSSTGQAKFSCNVEDITGVEKQMHEERMCMSIRIQQHGLDPKTLLFSSPNPDDVKSWIQHLNRTLNALWNLKYHESNNRDKQLPTLPSSSRASDSSHTSHSTTRPIQLSKRQLQSTAFTSKYSNYSDTREYGFFDVDSNASENEENIAAENDVAYSEHRSSCYQYSVGSSEALADLSESVQSSSESEDDVVSLPRLVNPDLWKHLNRAGNEMNRLNGALDLALTSPVATSTTNTISTAIIGFAAFLLQVNKMSRSLHSNPILQSLDSSTNDYYTFSNRVLVGLADPGTEVGWQNAQWELEWEVNELRSIAKNAAEDMIRLLQEL